MPFVENVIMTANNIKVALPPFNARTATLDQLAFNAQLTSIGRGKKNYVMMPRLAGVGVGKPVAVKVNFEVDYGHPPIFLLGSHFPYTYFNMFGGRVKGFRPTYTDNVQSPNNDNYGFSGNCHAHVFSSYAYLYNWDVQDASASGVKTKVEWMTLV